MTQNLKLSAPQEIFLNQLDTKFAAYVGGFGSGKTFIACIDLLLFALRNPGLKQAYFGPTYGSIRDVFFSTIVEAAELFRVRVVIKKGDKEAHLYVGRRYIGVIICRSMDDPNSIIGFKVANAVADELDTLNKEKAENAWNKILGRLRQDYGGIIRLKTTTTPEGFQFVYDKFAKNPTESYSMVQASSYENVHLPHDYISSLLETYPEQLRSAYIRGQFVNLKSGSVYTNFDRELNNTSRVQREDEVLFIGMDFNVENMSAITHVKEPNGDPAAVDEIVGALDTPEMIRVIKRKYPKNRVRVYPDSSGKNRKSSGASETDIALLSQAGFMVLAKPSNPPVKDRILAMQIAFNKGEERRYKVNVARCPTYADNLEQQVYNAVGEPDKKAGKDHTNDAGGYFIHYDYPVIRPAHKFKTTYAR